MANYISRETSKELNWAFDNLKFDLIVGLDAIEEFEGDAEHLRTVSADILHTNGFDIDQVWKDKVLARYMNPANTGEPIPFISRAKPMDYELPF